MTFVNISLLAGTALVALPIVLHLIMRRRPVRLEFPALRFIERRHDANRRRLRLRHLLLLLLRAAAIALLAFALARPSIQFSGLGSHEAPVAAAFVFDAAAHMEYRHENRSRLEAAQDMGLWLLPQLPEGSEIAVMDTRLGSTAAFQPDRGAAKERISRLETVANSQPLTAVISDAAKLLRQSRLARKEIYVFTDLARGAWPVEQSANLRREITAVGPCGAYVIDVGVAKSIDYGLGQPRLSEEAISSRGTLGIETDVLCMGEPAARTVELYLLDADGKPQMRGRQTCQAVPGEARPAQFSLSGLNAGTQQGFLRLVGQDGLAADDERYFTVEVKPPWRVLLAAPKPADSYTAVPAEMLAPHVYRRLGQAKFACDICDLDELAKRDLTGYDAVFLLDPTPPTAGVWKKLTDFVAEGHGLAVFLGRNAVPIDSFNSQQAQEVLPVKLLRQARRPDGQLHLAPREFQHPVLSAFRGFTVPWEAFPVFRYWQVDREPKGTSSLLSYSDGGPAVLERAVGQGRALLMTTPVSDRPNSGQGVNQDPWNLLAVSDDWPLMILLNRMADYLGGSGEQQLNYLAGETAVVRLGAAAGRTSYMLSAPGNMSFPIPADLSRRELSIAATDHVGNYRVQAGGAKGVDLGFSVNYAPQQTRLDRLTNQELSSIFGPLQFRLAHTRQQIDRDVSAGRVGRELFSALILIVALVVGAEMLVANRFYKG